jgi:hypothetical protein
VTTETDVKAETIDGGAEQERWYRNGWVWLVIAIPAATVAGCLVTIYLALAHPEEIVRDPAPAAYGEAP